MEQYLVSKDLAEKLKAAGFPQRTQFYWRIWHETGQAVLVDGVANNASGHYWHIAAPLSDEVLEQLPKLIGNARFPVLSYPVNMWVAAYTSDIDSWHTLKQFDYMQVAEKPADALAQLWLYCAEHNYLEGR